jgi:acyl transferase domain-containing protein
MTALPTDPRDVLRRALIEIRSLKERLAAAERAGPAPAEAVALVGIGCRFPGGVDSPASFWRLLEAGQDAIGLRPAGRWAATDGAAPREGGFLPDVEGFDARFFAIAPREAAAMDPQHRLLLEVTWEALEHAAIDPHSLAGSRTGVFVGLATNDYARRVPEPAVDRYFGVGSSPAVASGRIAYMLDLHGPCVTLDTACSSSLVAVHYAMRALRDHECDTALAGGVSLMLGPSLGESFVAAGMLAPDGRCKSFDARADGYGRGEGAGMVVLRRLSDALRDGDPVLAVLRGSAINQDGRSAGLTAPNGPAQTTLIRTALDAAGLTPADIDYVEAHGTGTPLGDPIEWHALAAAFSGRDRPLLVGAVKSNIGHTEAASGIAGLIKTVLALGHGAVPPSLHFTRLNPAITTGATLLALPTTSRTGVRRAGVSAFGFSGTNAHVVLEAPPPREPAPIAGADVLLLSAQDPAALRDLAARYAAAFDAGLPFAAACHTAATGRARFPWWIAAGSPNGLADLAPTDAPLPQMATTAGPRIALPTYPFQRERFPLPGAATTERVLAPDDPLLRGTDGLAHLGVLLTLLGTQTDPLADLAFPAPLVVTTPREVRVHRADGLLALQSRTVTGSVWMTHLSGRPSPAALPLSFPEATVRDEPWTSDAPPALAEPRTLAGMARPSGAVCADRGLLVPLRDGGTLPRERHGRGGSCARPPGERPSTRGWSDRACCDRTGRDRGRRTACLRHAATRGPAGDAGWCRSPDAIRRRRARNCVAAAPGCFG